ncbi:MAG TPA: T9SS type A sorting domain-containing protein [Chryseosolibacter sp.]
MKTYTLLILAWLGSLEVAIGQITLTTNGSARATAYSMQNKILSVARGNKIYTYFTYLKNRTDYHTNGAKKFDVCIDEYENNGAGPVSSSPRTFILGQTWEEYLDGSDFPEPHGGASLTLDASGKLHIVYGFHYSGLRHMKSNVPVTDPNQAGNLAFVEGDPISQSIRVTDSRTSDRWTYPVIKAKGNEIHLAGSLDAQYTDTDSDNIDDNNAKQIGYLKNSGSGWSYPVVSSTDPVNVYSPTYQCRYDVLMNIDKNDVIHILAPDQMSFHTTPDHFGHLNYYHFKSGNHGNSFVRSSNRPYINNTSLDEKGYSNIAFDQNGDIHFLVFASDDFSNSSNFSVEKMQHVLFDPVSGARDLEDVPGTVEFPFAQDGKLRIDNYDQMFVVLQNNNRDSNGRSGWTTYSNSISIATKNPAWDFSEPFQMYEIVDASGELAWIPTIEEEEKYTADKNWFYIMWQQRWQTPDAVKALKIIPYDTYISNKTLSKHAEYYAAHDLQISGTVTLSSAAHVDMIAKNKIVFNEGFTASAGSYLSAKADNPCAGNRCLENQVASSSRLRTTEPDPEKRHASNEPMLGIYPNPAHDGTWIERPTSEAVTVELVNSMGESIRARVIQIEDPARWYLDLSTEPAGLYFVKLKTQRQSKVIRLIKR